MANKIMCFLLMLSFCYTRGNAQDVNYTSKIEVNKIKKDSKYIYGEGVAETEEKCIELAEMRFKENLEQYIKSIPSLDTAYVVTIPQIKKVMKKITFDRTNTRKVVFLYVPTSEIIPLFAGKKENPTTTLPVEVETPTPNEEVTRVQPKELDYEGLSLKDAEILQKIVDLQTFDKIKEFLILRKSTNHDIHYKGTNDFNTISGSGYWIVFNSDRTIISIIGKDAKTILYNKEAKKFEDFLSKGKIWLAIK